MYVYLYMYVYVYVYPYMYAYSYVYVWKSGNENEMALLYLNKGCHTRTNKRPARVVKCSIAMPMMDANVQDAEVGMQK